MTSLDEKLNIDTPENVVFGFEVAGIASRFMAAIVDSILITLLQALLGVIVLASVLLLIDEGSLTSRLEEDLPALAWLIALVGLTIFIINWGYYILFEMIWNGQTPGKRLVGLRVIRSNGLPVGLPESAIRNLVRIVDFLPAYYGIGVIAMFIDDQDRRLGDLAAGTLVVRERSAITLETLEKEQQAAAALVAAPGVGGDLPDDLPVSRLSSADLRLAEDFRSRRAELANRAEIAVQVAGRLCERLGLDASAAASSQEAETLIARVVKSSRGKG